MLLGKHVGRTSPVPHVTDHQIRHAQGCAQPNRAILPWEHCELTPVPPVESRPDQITATPATRALRSAS